MSYMGFKQCVIATWTVGLNNVATKTRSSATAERQRVSYMSFSVHSRVHFTSPHLLLYNYTGWAKKVSLIIFATTLSTASQFA